MTARSEEELLDCIKLAEIASEQLQEYLEKIAEICKDKTKAK